MLVDFFLFNFQGSNWGGKFCFKWKTTLKLNYQFTVTDPPSFPSHMFVNVIFNSPLNITHITEASPISSSQHNWRVAIKLDYSWLYHLSFTFSFLNVRMSLESFLKCFKSSVESEMKVLLSTTWNAFFYLSIS